MNKEKKVIVFGTFDGFHKGHLDFLKQAKKTGKKLFIVVARDKNVRKIKGRMPKFNEKYRLEEVKKQAKKIDGEVLLGSLKNPFVPIKKIEPDIIALGYDQSSFSKGLENKFPKIKIIRLKPYKPDIYKSSIIKLKQSKKSVNHYFK